MKATLTTSKGDVTLELDEQAAPKTCANFKRYAEEGHYDGTIFHRVIPGFMIQGGGFTDDMSQKKTHESIPNEASNGLKNDKGTVAMARTPDPHSASSQFFVNLTDNDFLNFRDESQAGSGYCVFGKVVDGMDTVSSIASVETGGPLEPDPLTDFLTGRWSAYVRRFGRLWRFDVDHEPWPLRTARARTAVAGLVAAADGVMLGPFRHRRSRWWGWSSRARSSRARSSRREASRAPG